VLYPKIQKIYFRSWISSSTEQKKLLKNCQRTSNMPARSIILNQKTFIKKSLRFFDSGIALNQFLESPINLNSTFSHNPHSTSLICCWTIWVKTNLTGIKIICFVLMRQAKRFHDIFESLDETNAENIRKQYNTIVLPLYRFYWWRKPNYLLIRITRFLNAIINSILKTAIQKQNITLKNWQRCLLRLCNTHRSRNRLGGLQKIQVENKTQEAIKLVYADNDIVYVSIHSLQKSQNIPKMDNPKIYKLGRMPGRF
jgi:transcription-repair coupling factor (superfamily II helicase)